MNTDNLKKHKSIHSQISEWIRKRIESGEYGENEKLPSEHEISRIFDVSRVTVRRALQTLEAEGRIYRTHGVGSFVSDNRQRQSLIKLTDFNEDMKSSGLKASSEVIKFSHIKASKLITEKLKLKKDSTVIRIDRVRMGDGAPVAFDYTWLPLFYGQLLDGLDLSNKTIYSIFEKDYEIPIVRGFYSITAENSDSYLAEHLDIREGKALLVIERLSLTLKDKPVYYQKRYYNSDKVIYELLLERDPDDKSSGSGMPLRELLPVFRK